MEIITIRVPLHQIRKVEQIANSSNGRLQKSDVWREIITSGLEKTASKQQKILIEILMILRSTIKDDEQYGQILQTIDEFKTVQELGNE